MTIFCLLTGIGSNILACGLSDLNAAGSESITFGLLGGMLGLYILYWGKIDVIP